MSRHLAAVPDRPLLRALLYVRVSAIMGRGGDTFLSPEIQTGTMRRALPMHGLREVGQVEDLDVSGTSFEREGLDKVLAMADRREFEVLLCYDTSRFGRDVLESLLFLRDLAQRGVHIIAVSEGIDTSTDHGMTMLINMLNVAQLRAREIGRGWRQTIATRARAGKLHGPVPPTGYERGDDGRLRPHPDHGEAVTRAAVEYADGDPVADVRRRLSARLGRNLTQTTLKRILTSRVYLGHVPLPGGEEVADAHEPLIVWELWQRVQARVERDRGRPPRVVGAGYSLTGLARCALCGASAIVMTDTRRDGRKVKRLKCGVSRWGRCPGCGMPALETVEEEVLARLTEYLAELRGDVTAAAKAARSTRAGVDVRALRRELEQTRRAMVRLTTGWARQDAGEDDAVYRESMAALRGDEQRLAGQLAQVREVAAAPDVAATTKLGEQLLTMWPELTGGGRNAVLRKLVRVVVIRPAGFRWQPYAERVTVDWL